MSFLVTGRGEKKEREKRILMCLVTLFVRIWLWKLVSTDLGRVDAASLFLWLNLCRATTNECHEDACNVLPFARRWRTLQIGLELCSFSGGSALAAASRGGPLWTDGCRAASASRFLQKRSALCVWRDWQRDGARWLTGVVSLPVFPRRVLSWQDTHVARVRNNTVLSGDRFSQTGYCHD